MYIYMYIYIYIYIIASAGAQHQRRIRFCNGCRVNSGNIGNVMITSSDTCVCDDSVHHQRSIHVAGGRVATVLRIQTEDSELYDRLSYWAHTRGLDSFYWCLHADFFNHFVVTAGKGGPPLAQSRYIASPRAARGRFPHHTTHVPSLHGAVCACAAWCGSRRASPATLAEGAESQMMETDGMHSLIDTIFLRICAVARIYYAHPRARHIFIIPGFTSFSLINGRDITRLTTSCIGRQGSCWRTLLRLPGWLHPQKMTQK
jgi:hypothetical protein